MKFTGRLGPKFSIGGVKGFSSTSESGLVSADCCYLEVDGRHPLSKSIRSDRIFFVHEGTGTFTISDKTYEIVQGDMLVVPKGTAFEYAGKMILIEFGTPSFEASGEVELETEE